MISVHAFLCFDLVAAALLALWVVARFPRRGPKSVRSAIACCIGALVLLQLVPVGVVAMIRLPYGDYAVLFGCALPAFFLVFLAAAWLMRTLASSLGGSSGGPGDYIPADAKG